MEKQFEEKSIKYEINELQIVLHLKNKIVVRTVSISVTYYNYC